MQQVDPTKQKHRCSPCISFGTRDLSVSRGSTTRRTRSAPVITLVAIMEGRHQHSASPRKLFHKVELLSACHSRSIEALGKLRQNNTRPIRAWEDASCNTKITPGDPASSLLAIDRHHKTNSSSSMGNCNTDSIKQWPGQSRTMRVTTKAKKSSEGLRHSQATEVEPFWSMETHAIAWKRKMRQLEEARQRSNSLSGCPPVTCMK